MPANKTPLYDKHLACKAKIVDFHGWSMPLHYGSQIDEHHAVRNQAGMFDVSHMMVTDIWGLERAEFLSSLLANDIGKLEEGQALYSLMLNDHGGIIDDLIVYHCGYYYRLVTNAGTRDKVSAWLALHAESFSVDIKVPNQYILLAIQGPSAKKLVCQAVEEEASEKIRSIKKFTADFWQNWFIANTGYTGEQGIEILLPIDEGLIVWDKLIDVGVSPCGLGARDTLRLEAGLNLYGADMDEACLPQAANLTWTLAMGEKGQTEKREFVGRKALESRKVETELVGLVLEGRAIPRSGQPLYADHIEDNDDNQIPQEAKVGVITSGSYSPTLGVGIAFARVSRPAQSQYQVHIRKKLCLAKRVSLPFVKDGKKVFSIYES